jgi:DtxR family Mn-dependent transcriptional regulator
MVIRLTMSTEDYLEAIALLANEGNPVTVTGISRFLRVKKPSVTHALSKLSAAGLVEHDRYRDVTLTTEGARIAQDVYRRHKTLRQFLLEILNVDPMIAEDDACRIEHFLSPVSLERLAKFIEFVLHCPRGEPEWLKGFNYYFEHGERDKELLARCQREGSRKS